MFFRMKLNVCLEIHAEFLEYGLCKVGLSLILATGKEEFQTFTDQWFLLHNTGRSGGITNGTATRDGTALELDGGIYILIEEVKNGFNGIKGFIACGAEPDSNLFSVFY